MEIVNLTFTTIFLFRMDHAEWLSDEQRWWLPEKYHLTDVLASLPPAKYSTRSVVDRVVTISVGSGVIPIKICSPGYLPPPKENTYYLVEDGTLVPSDRDDFLKGGDEARDYDGNFLGYLTLLKYG